MKTVHTDFGIELYADEGRAIRQKGSDGPIVASVALSSADSPENWEDCDLWDDRSTHAVSAE